MDRNLSRLNRFERSTHSFVRYYPNPGDSPEYSRNRIRSITQDQNGLLWIATNAGLHAFDPDTDTFIPIKSKLGDDSSLQEESLRALHVDQTGELWVGTINGLSRFERELGYSYQPPFDAQGSLQHQQQ